MKREIVYFDKEGKITDKDNASKFIIRNLGVNGELLEETWGYVTTNDDDRSKILISQEQYDYLVSIGQTPDMTRYGIRK